MAHGEPITFGAFRLDPVAGEVRRHGRRVALRGKSFAVPLYLARRPDCTTTRQEIFDAVRPRTAVSATVLRVCIRKIRAALASRRR